MAAFSAPERSPGLRFALCRSSLAFARLRTKLRPYSGDFFGDFAPFLALYWRSQ